MHAVRCLHVGRVDVSHARWLVRKEEGTVARLVDRLSMFHRLLCTGCCAVLVLYVLGFAARATAQSVVVGPGFAEGHSSHQVELATTALTSALGMQGLTVVQPSGTRDAVLGDLGDIVPAAAAAKSKLACDQACGAGLIAAASAELSAWVFLRRADAAHSGNDTSTVTLQDAAGHRFEGVAELRDGDVRDATTRAMLEARSYHLLGPGPWLNLVGTPDGAEVLVDGQRVGVLPYRGTIAAGQHEVVVREAGYVKHSESVSVPDEQSRRMELKVALEPAPLAPPPGAVALDATESESGPSSAWLAAPVAMGTLGVGLAAVLTVRIITGLECSEPCLEKRSLRAAPTIGGYALSAALIGASVTWIVLGMQPDEATESNPSAVSRANKPKLRASVGLGHVQLSGSF
jgi:hypothetical protein